MALTGVGKTFAGVYGIADNLLSGLVADALVIVDIVDAVGRSSSVARGRPCPGVSRRRIWPR